MLQVADVTFDPLKVPQWFMTALIVVVALGFPFALVMAWAFQMTPAGVKRDANDATLSVDGDSPSLDERAVAVIPFVDISPQRDNEHFTDGLTEELLTALRRIPDLRIASRTSCFAFKGKNSGIAEVAEKLQVNHLVEGSVRKSGDKLRVSVQLIETNSDTQLWSECYDGSLDEIFTVQQDISEKICSALQITLRAQDSPKPTTDDPQAYDYFLRGLGFFTSKGSADIVYAIDMFTRATELDPGFVKAWTQLISSLTMNAVYQGDASSSLLAEDAARKLLKLAPDDADTYSAYGMSLLTSEKYSEAIVQLKKALEIDGNNLDALNYYARAAFHSGDMKTALKMFKRAAHCDPEDWEAVLLSLPLYDKLGDGKELMKAGREGVNRVERFLQIYPNNQRAYYLGASALLLLGEERKAHLWIEKSLQIAPNDSATRYNAGCFYAQAGESDKAFANLRESIASLSWIENDPDLDPLRDDPRFPVYLESLRKGEEQDSSNSPSNIAE